MPVDPRPAEEPGQEAGFSHGTRLNASFTAREPWPTSDPQSPLPPSPLPNLDPLRAALESQLSGSVPSIAAPAPASDYQNPAYDEAWRKATRAPLSDRTPGKTIGSGMRRSAPYAAALVSLLVTIYYNYNPAYGIAVGTTLYATIYVITGAAQYTRPLLWIIGAALLALLVDSLNRLHG